MGFKLWPGRWVKFAGSLPGAFRSTDGMIVGIFCAGDYSTNTPYIAVVDDEGTNLMVDVAGEMIQAKVSPIQPLLEPVLDRKDIPPERIKHLPKDWQPRQ